MLCVYTGMACCDVILLKKTVSSNLQHYTDRCILIFNLSTIQNNVCHGQLHGNCLTSGQAITITLRCVVVAAHTRSDELRSKILPNALITR